MRRDKRKGDLAAWARMKPSAQLGASPGIPTAPTSGPLIHPLVVVVPWAFFPLACGSLWSGVITLTTKNIGSRTRKSERGQPGHHGLRAGCCHLISGIKGLFGSWLNVPHFA
jgi:hypothetical protein